MRNSHLLQKLTIKTTRHDRHVSYRTGECAKNSPQGCITISRCSTYHLNIIYVNGKLTVSVLVCYKSFTTEKLLELLRVSWMSGHIVWQKFTDVSEECIASVFCTEG
jgi:hypothetical protein